MSDDTTQNWPNCPTELRDRVQYEVSDVYEYLSIQEPGIIHQIPLKIEPVTISFENFQGFCSWVLLQNLTSKNIQMLVILPMYPSPIIFRMEPVHPRPSSSRWANEVTWISPSGRLQLNRFAEGDEAHAGPYPYHPCMVCMVYVVPGDWVVPNHQPLGFLPSTINQARGWFLW